MSEGVGHRITLCLNEAGEVLDEQRNVLPLGIPGFHITGPLESEPTDLSQSDQTAGVAPAKLIELRCRRMFCGEEDLGELLSIGLDVAGEPDESGFVTVQFPVS